MTELGDTSADEFFRVPTQNTFDGGSDVEESAFERDDVNEIRGRFKENEVEELVTVVRVAGPVRGQSERRRIKMERERFGEAGVVEKGSELFGDARHGGRVAPPVASDDRACVRLLS